MPTRKTPKEFSAYVLTDSDIQDWDVGMVLIDTGRLLVRDWNVIDFDTGTTTSAIGKRLLRLCPECRVEHGKVGMLGHDGDHGLPEVADECRAEIAAAKNKVDL